MISTSFRFKVIVTTTMSGILPGKCVDDEYIAKTFGISVTSTKDPSQREACGCVVSKDIGMYDSCLYGCPYCYAVSSFERARINCLERHDPNSPSLIGWYDTRSRTESLQAGGESGQYEDPR